MIAFHKYKRMVSQRNFILFALLLSLVISLAFAHAPRGANGASRSGSAGSPPPCCMRRSLTLFAFSDPACTSSPHSISITRDNNCVQVENNAYISATVSRPATAHSHGRPDIRLSLWSTSTCNGTPLVANQSAPVGSCFKLSSVSTYQSFRVAPPHHRLAWWAIALIAVGALALFVGVVYVLWRFRTKLCRCCPCASCRERVEEPTTTADALPSHAVPVATYQPPAPTAPSTAYQPLLSSQ